MKEKKVLVALVAMVACLSASAEPATDADVQEFFAASHVEKILDSVQRQTEGLMRNALNQSLNGKAPTPKQQEAIDTMRASMAKVMNDVVSWGKMEPMFLRLYKETFTREEVQAMTAFYKSPAGQSMVNKMPALMQKTMGEVQNMMRGVAPQLQAIQQKFTADMKAAE